MILRNKQMKQTYDKLEQVMSEIRIEVHTTMIEISANF